MVLCGCFRDVLRVFQGSFKSVSKVLQGLHFCLKYDSRVFQLCFEDVSKMF